MIGRHKEIAELERIYQSDESEFVMIYGRRRVGKTYLVREFFKNDFVFYCTGIADGTKEEELINFSNELRRYDDGAGRALPRNWMEAFDMLDTLVEKSRKKRKVIFLDEVPWMYTQKSDFLKALEHFWNSRISQRKDVVLVICGSAASWMVKKIIKSKGGLHNRITLKLRLQQFTLKESREYLKSLGIQWDNRAVAECYMALGGIPYYMKLLDRSMSLSQNIDRLFFRDAALLEDEISNLYSSLFRDSKDYVKIVEILSKRKSGYTREEIIRLGNFTDGGGITEKLADLEQCDFIRKYNSAGNVQHTYQLCDFFTLFHFQFIRKGRTFDADTWKGLAFERLCLAHLPQIKNALGISGISTNSFSYHSDKVQVDLVIERGDKVTNICEMKYYDGPYTLGVKEAEKLKEKMAAVKAAAKRRRTHSIVMITSEGMKPNEYYYSLVQREIVLDDLFC